MCVEDGDGDGSLELICSIRKSFVSEKEEAVLLNTALRAISLEQPR